MTESLAAHLAAHGQPLPATAAGPPEKIKVPVIALPPRIESVLGNVKSAPKEDQSDTTLVILPDPVGHKMLVALPTMAEMTAGGIILPAATNERERAAAVVGRVLAMGLSCYKDKQRFPDGPWCEVGQTIMFSRYAGMRFKTKDTESGEMVEYRILNDDEITGTVPPGAEVGGL